MTKKYTYLVHIALFLAAMILLCLGFFLESPNGGLITEQRAMPTCKEVQEVAEETRSDAAAPQGVTREFHFTLDNNLTEKQLMFYVINSNTKVYINGELVFDKHRIETNKVSATGCYWVNLTLPAFFGFIESLLISKAIPHKDCATDASSNFSSDETKSGVNT